VVIVGIRTGGVVVVTAFVVVLCLPALVVVNDEAGAAVTSVVASVKFAVCAGVEGTD